MENLQQQQPSVSCDAALSTGNSGLQYHKGALLSLNNADIKCNVNQNVLLRDLEYNSVGRVLA